VSCFLWTTLYTSLSIITAMRSWVVITLHLLWRGLKVRSRLGNNHCIVNALNVDVPGMMNGPPQWRSRSEHSKHSSSTGDSPPPRPPPMIRSTSSQLPPSLPPKQPRPLSHHSVPLRNEPPARNDPPVDPHVLSTLQSFAAGGGVTSFPSPPSQPVATIPRRQSAAAAVTPSGPRVTRAPPPSGPSADVVGSKTESEDNSSNECAVCLEQAPDCVLYQCGHMCMCYNCAVGLHESADPSCPICRQPILDIIKIYRS